MENFDKHMALDEIEDALTGLHTPYGRGVAVGLCGAFYMCGLLSTAEWETFMARIPAEILMFEDNAIRPNRNQAHFLN